MDYYRTVEINELIAICEGRKVVIYGTGEQARRLKKGMEGFGIKVFSYTESTGEKYGTYLDGIPVIPLDDPVMLNNPVIVFGTIKYVTLSEQLYRRGIRDIYILFGCPVNSYEETLEDRKVLQQYFDDYDRKKSDKILVEVYTHMGDVFVKTGICKVLIHYFGIENVFFLVDESEQKALGDYLKLLTPHVYRVQRDRFSEDTQYRRNLLKQLNEQYFKFSYTLTDIKGSIKFRFLHRMILNVDATYYMDADNDYVNDKDYKMLQGILCRDVRAECEESNDISPEIDRLPDIEGLPESFVAVSMGAANQLRRYPVEKFKRVVEYLIEQGHTLVFLGYGAYDEQFVTSLSDEEKYRKHIVSYVSKLQMLESLKVISKCDFFVGTDSGMCHAAFVLGKKSVVIIGKGEYGRFMHPSERVLYVLSKGERCLGCTFWNCRKQDLIEGVAPCVADVSPEDIIEKIAEV